MHDMLNLHVRKGTNGAVTMPGLLAAAAAGTLIGVTFVLVGLFTATCSSYVVGLKQLWVIPLSVLPGLCGSLIDSLLGATLQFSGFCRVRNKVVGTRSPTVKKISGFDILDNNAVNLLSMMLTTLLTSIACTCYVRRCPFWFIFILACLLFSPTSKRSNSCTEISRQKFKRKEDLNAPRGVSVFLAANYFQSLSLSLSLIPDIPIAETLSGAHDSLLFPTDGLPFWLMVVK
ncbi:hypothetical protein Ancab_006950 [Ancistrocladus abbreviatus]